ncbi:MAG: hypothetical protein HOH74_19685 [Gemmatimonadetes bacterium]|nr:hypothetical protein [Gemmatimonadota bacterium]
MNWPEDNSNDNTPDPGRRGRLLEDIFILLCVLSLWPVILGWQHFLYEVLLYGALGGLVFVLVRRARRFSEARREVDEP